MAPQLLLCSFFYLTAVTVAFPGYFEDDDENHYSQYENSHYKHDLTPTLNPLAESTEPTVDIAKTQQIFPTHRLQVQTKRLQGLTKHQEVPKKHKKVPIKHQKVTKKHQVVPKKHQEILKENQVPKKNHEIPKKNRGVSKKRRLVQTTHGARLRDSSSRTKQTYPVLTKHGFKNPQKRDARNHMKKGDIDKIKKILGGDFLDGSWVVTETRLIESDTEPLPENWKHFLTPFSPTRSTTQVKQFYFKAKLRLGTDSDSDQDKMISDHRRYQKIGEMDTPIVVIDDVIDSSTGTFLTGRHVDVTVSGSAGPDEDSASTIDYADYTSSPGVFSTSIHGDLLSSDEDLLTISSSPEAISTLLHDDLLSPDEDLRKASAKTIPLKAVVATNATVADGDFSVRTKAQRLPIRSEKSTTMGITIEVMIPACTSRSKTLAMRRYDLITTPAGAATMKDEKSSYPAKVWMNGSWVDWKKALRKGELFDFEKFVRQGETMTTKRKRKYVFVTQDTVYRVCVLADYKSLIVSCSIDNAMTICVRNLAVNASEFENEQGVRYRGTIVVCPALEEIGQTWGTTQICVNRRRTEFAIRCPPKDAKWTALTRCVQNYKRAPWRGPFDYMFGEAWVGTVVSCPIVPTTQQWLFYITQTCPTTSYPILDVEGLLALVANLTYDYQDDLVGKLNKSLYIFLSPPSKPTGLETTTPEYVAYDDKFRTGEVVAKCYFCGMTETGIPYSAACSDAFSHEMVPLSPIDPRARAQVGRYRKYCRWDDVRNWHMNSTELHSVYGRWSGGCAVRWVDISGVYTERVCRNRHRPVTGRSFASKRMAKLELALLSVDNGCITSPMAVLVPFSRAISLYARFHACVCTGNFCNGSGKRSLDWAVAAAVAAVSASTFHI